MLIDFGLACVIQNKHARCKKINGKILGNCCKNDRGIIPYMSPESFFEDIAYPSSDLWSLGVTVFKMVTGNNIWLEPSWPKIQNNFHNRVQPVKLKSGDNQLDSVINSFLQIDMSKRMSVNEAIKILRN